MGQHRPMLAKEINLSNLFYTSVDRMGQYVHVRGYENGQRVERRFNYSPTLFVPSKEETGYKDIYGVPQMPINFQNMYDASSFMKETKSVSNGTVNGMDNYILAFISDTFENQQPDINLIRVRNIDIEVFSATFKDPSDASTAVPDGFPDPDIARWPIDAITMYDNIDDIYYVYSTREWSKSRSNLDPEILAKVKFVAASNEKDLLSSFLIDWRGNYADIVTGWFTNSFDIPYLYKRITLLFGATCADSLSPLGQTEVKTQQDNNNGQRTFIKLVGMAQLDLIELYKKFTYTPRASYKLGYIATAELGTTKVDYAEEGNLVQLALFNPVKYVDYNIIDVDLVKSINDKLKLIDLAVYMAYDAGMNYEDVYSPIKQWDSIIFNHLKKEKVVIPMKRHARAEPFEGAYVKDVLVGFHRNVLSFDLESLYPGIIRQVNISPETFVGIQYSNGVEDYIDKSLDLSSSEYSVAANGAIYRTDVKGVLPIVVGKVFANRKIFKEKMKEAKHLGDQDGVVKYNLLQMAAKIAINSAYGALGNAYFRYYSLANAEAVTKTGQVIIRWSERKFNLHFQGIFGDKKDRVVAIDTDSCYVSFEDFVNKYMPEKTDSEVVDILDQYAEKKMQPLLNGWYKELSEYMKHPESLMYMKRECIATTSFFIAKKRYAMYVWDNEGYRYPTPELKIIGLETQRSSTPTLARTGLGEAIRIILSEDEINLKKYCKTLKAEFMEIDYREISNVTTANNLRKYSDLNMMPGKGCPGHIKGVLAYNRLVEKLEGVEPIKEGERVALITLREPNRYMAPSMAYLSGMSIPDELDPGAILALMDRDTMFEKAFEAPLDKICNAIKWKFRDEVSLEDFFC